MYQYLLVLILAVSAAQQPPVVSCFNPDGSVVPLSIGYHPCISTQNVDSMCCFLNITVLESEDPATNFLTSICLTNGMCEQTEYLEEYTGYYRGSCTDKTWKSPNCLKACTDASVSALPLLHVESHMCGTWRLIKGII
jgi:hypothetical protein